MKNYEISRATDTKAFTTKVYEFVGTYEAKNKADAVQQAKADVGTGKGFWKAESAK